MELPVAGTRQPPPEAQPASQETTQPRQGARLALEQQWSLASAGDCHRCRTHQCAPCTGAPVYRARSGEPSWSYKNRGYGAYRRTALGGRKPRVAQARARRRRSAARQCQGAPGRARQHQCHRRRASIARLARRAGGRSLFQMPRSRRQPMPRARLRDSDEEASEQAWESVDGLVGAALKATNGALAQAGAQFVALDAGGVGERPASPPHGVVGGGQRRRRGAHAHRAAAARDGGRRWRARAAACRARPAPPHPSRRHDHSRARRAHRQLRLAGDRPLQRDPPSWPIASTHGLPLFRAISWPLRPLSLSWSLVGIFAWVT